jgi:hypothetical protein
VFGCVSFSLVELWGVVTLCACVRFIKTVNYKIKNYVRNIVGESQLIAADAKAAALKDAANDASTAWSRAASEADAHATRTCHVLSTNLLLRILLMQDYSDEVKLETIRNIVRREDAARSEATAGIAITPSGSVNEALQPSAPIQTYESGVTLLMAELCTARTHFSKCVCERCKVMRTREKTNRAAHNACVNAQYMRTRYCFNPNATNQAARHAFRMIDRAWIKQEGPAGRRHTEKKLFFARSHRAILRAEKILDTDGLCLRLCLRVCLRVFAYVAKSFAHHLL